MKLQLLIQEANQGVQQVSRDMLDSLPRVLRDLEAVKQDAFLLHNQMQVVKEDIKKVAGLEMSSLTENSLVICC